MVTSAQGSLAAELAGRRFGGGYVLSSLVGRGGMGAVYEATAPDGARVAVKVLRLPDDALPSR